MQVLYAIPAWACFFYEFHFWKGCQKDFFFGGWGLKKSGWGIIFWGGIKNFLIFWSSSINSCMSSKVVFHQMSSSIKGCLPQKSSSIRGCLPSKFISHQRSSSIKGRLSSKVVFHQRSPAIKGRILSKVDLMVSVAQLSSARLLQSQSAWQHCWQEICIES